VRAAVESNYKTMTEVLRPGGGGGGGGGSSEAARVYHNIGGAKAELPDHMVLNLLALLVQKYTY
jgi:hypothetical protein